jgi:hypothetical protein
MECWHGNAKGMCLECLHEDDGSTWGQQENDVWSVGKTTTRVHTKRVGIKLYDCEHGILRSQCREGSGGGAICDHGIQRSQCREGCGGGSICDHGIQRSQCMEGCGGGALKLKELGYQLCAGRHQTSFPKAR